jgi:hypothetical protein
MQTLFDLYILGILIAVFGVPYVMLRKPRGDR